ncbi:PH domain-containing protein [Aquiflexum sp. LQ15W]|uniref:PH domain-containing protein n=1 Tax=Cognataquiflexum nitidum TaxID=2922272 RepID=UPI001F135390|nr:PH domain-containing protein [Cognataquiflexum nitidum]MCH6198128.1 PH domain-containing protein [Cognataquiflexum nitidum]
MKKYKAKKGTGIKILLALSILFPVLVYVFESQLPLNFSVIFLLLLIPILMLSWVYLSTDYWIDKGKLFYKSAFLKGDIDILQITRITKNKTMWTGVKPAMAGKGLIIKMKYDEIYVAPEVNEEMIEDLLKINSGIEVVE